MHPEGNTRPPGRIRERIGGFAICLLALVAVHALAAWLWIAAGALWDLPAVPANGGPIPARTFVVLALVTDVALLGVAGALVALHPGSLSLGLPPRAAPLLLGSSIAVIAVNLAGARAMHWAGETYSGLPDVPIGWGALPLVLAAVVAAPIAEEIFFREALLCRVLAPLPRGVAIVVSSLAFGALHAGVGGPFLIGSLSLMGAVLAHVRLRTGSIGAAVAVHAGNNAFALLVSLASRG